jgi:polyisoprenoid-binding protein YceI
MEDMQTEQELTTSTPRLGHYNIDVSRSRVRFRTRHMFGLAPVRGTFAIRSGSVDIAEPLSDSAICAEIDTASFRTRNPQRDMSVRSARLLNSSRFLVMTFGNGRVSAGDGVVTGELTVRDVTRPVTLAIRKVAVSVGGFTATATVRIDRTDFGVTALRGLAARYLDLSVEVRCVRK